MVRVLDGEAEDEDRDGHDGGREPDDDEAGFGLDVARVPALVVVADKIVQPVAEDGAGEGADYGREIEEAWRGIGIAGSLGSRGKRGKVEGRQRTEIVRGELVDCGQPNGDGGVDADDPREVEEEINSAYEYGKLRNGNDGTHEGLKESLSEVARLPLLNSDKSK